MGPAHLLCWFLCISPSKVTATFPNVQGTVGERSQGYMRGPTCPFTAAEMVEKPVRVPDPPGLPPWFPTSGGQLVPRERNDGPERL